jgi:uncharacterized protein YndB with AHSA1/START domain
MTERSIVHGTFTIERSYRHAPAVVFAAWSRPENKRQWFGSPEEGNPAQLFDFRVGGREFNEAKMGEDTYIYDVTYRDIVENNRIIFTYEMLKNGERISVSVATIEMKPEGSGTKLVLREDGAFLDGLDFPKQREDGTNYLMDLLGAWLDKQ